MQSAAGCWAANCSKKKVPSFSPSNWHDDICGLRSAPAYDQSGYDGYLRMVHRVRVSMAVLVGIIACVLVMMGLGALSADEPEYGVPLILGAIALVLLVIVPVYTALWSGAVG